MKRSLKFPNWTKDVRTGDRMPEYLFRYVRDRTIATPHLRRCVNCQFEWVTCEVPLAKNWDGGESHKCPMVDDHNFYEWGQRRQAAVIDCVPISTIKRVGFVVPGKAMVVLLGGYYRRRECKEEGCVTEDGSRTRWTTIELLPEGYLVEDVAVCARCGDYGKAKRWAFRPEP